MKRKFSLIKIILAIAIIILCICAAIGYVDSKVLMPYLLTSLGIIQIYNGVHFYKEDRKTEGILAILSSVFILGVVIKSL
ncbi:hypothetical protein CPJCM30710_25220 [Clostridium polyendosporum]|uniref:DUF3953 domain-containing protein n=1 Tax=Clostridium polyendosporum TaxID=69208 RepID=A0A919S0S9_9CLOT|nr:hypothetical protein [Clostridium polyendosporum]GIM29856.1 hypothetical protein CPJCM30710_25220 [Clostridium polyendosporum]